MLRPAPRRLGAGAAGGGQRLFRPPRRALTAEGRRREHRHGDQRYGDEAIAELKAGGIDCILLDLGLPDAEGKRYRLRERGGGQVPTAQASRLRPSA